MREIVMDTETTGLDPNSGDRIVEIGAVELFNHMPTGKTYHQYINPQRDMPEGAFAVHGLSAEFLSDKPLFTDIAQVFLDFVGDSKMVIHNASFDMKFLNAELKWVERPELPWAQALDTLAIARKKFPGAQVSNNDATDGGVAASWTPPPRPNPLPSRITEVESEAHKEFVEKLGEAAVWKQFK
jgi:DNA polymerase-3 subunit epsilon